LMNELERFISHLNRRTSQKIETIHQENRRLDYLLLTLLLFLLAMTLLGWFYTRRRILRPLHTMIGWTKRIEEGRFHITNTLQGRDEIAQLARSFTRMADTVAQSLSDLSDKAHTDHLTGLPNRAFLDGELERLQPVIAFHEMRGGVILIDLDHFKRINDRYGHDIGDQVLKRFADFLRQHVPDPHLVGRWGGEEFLVITRHVSCRETSTLANTLREELSRWDFSDRHLHLTASFGVSEFRKDLTTDLTIKDADIALYRAKKLGRDRVERECVDS